MKLVKLKCEDLKEMRIFIDGKNIFLNLGDSSFNLGYTKTTRNKKYLRKDKIINICNALCLKYYNNKIRTININKDNDFYNIYCSLKDIVLLARYSKCKNKYKFGQWLENTFNVQVVGDEKFEHDFIPVIRESLKIFNPIEQFQVLNYKIDLYLPKYKIAIECDEYCHKDHKLEDAIRQEEIENILHCKFIRFEPTRDLNVGIIINKILKEILHKNI
jgi:very-short-patch-repair endonuclease